MIISPIKANKLCKPAGIGKDDSSSRRIANDVSEQMDANSSGISQIETGPGDTLESVAKGHLRGSGQKVDIGSMLFEQHKILSENYDQIKGGMKGKEKDPENFRTFRGRELPQGIKINLNTNNTQHSMAPANPMERSQSSPSMQTKENEANDNKNQDDNIEAQNDSDSSNFYAGAGSISNTQYALEFQDVQLSDDVKKGMSKFFKPDSWMMG